VVFFCLDLASYDIASKYLRAIASVSYKLILSPKVALNEY